MTSTYNLVAWKAYNCYSASVGSLLAFAGFPFLGVALNSGWDFYFDPSNIGKICMAGVYPGTEHPQLSVNINRIYQAEIKFFRSNDWDSCLGRLLAGLQRQELPLLCVENRACSHIPGSATAEPLSHYLIALRITDDSLLFFDSFLNRYGSLPLASLSRAMQFETADGERVGFRTATLRYDTPAHHILRRAKEAAGRVFFSRSPDTPAGAGKTTGLPSGVAAIRLLRRCLLEMERPMLEKSLRPLSEALRYVQYQRKYFVESLMDIRSLFPRYEKTCLDLMLQADNISDSWFRLKIKMLYNLRKGSSNLLEGVDSGLDGLSTMEEQAVEQLGHLSHLLQTTP